MVGALSNLENSLLGLKLKPITTKELVLHAVAPGDLYRFENSQYTITFKKGQRIDRDLLKSLSLKGYVDLYAEAETLAFINKEFRELFLKSARSLSIGDPEAKSKKQINLLSMNLKVLYKDPLNDAVLNMQFKGSQNLVNFLMENKGLYKKLYADIIKFDHHFIISQPILSSLLTVGFLEYLKVFATKELENLFLTSAFKDIGMSFVPKDKYDIKNPDKKDKQVFKSHSESSKLILDGRVPLQRNHLNIIKNHHFLSDKVNLIRKGEKIAHLKGSENITGIETLIVAVMDIIVAMTQGRPYEQKHSLFDTLELVKPLMEHEYPVEFRALIMYLRKFFS
jgi:HD-GYP domain-containing protein (c-di-GMP phosphodiesterase class II)